MTPAQPLLPFFPTFAALERAAKPGGPGNGAGNGAGNGSGNGARNDAREPARREARELAAAAPSSGDDAVTHSYEGGGDVGSSAGLAGFDDDAELVTLVRPELQLPRAPQLPRPQLFARFAGSARGSSPDLLRRRR